MVWFDIKKPEPTGHVNPYFTHQSLEKKKIRHMYIPNQPVM